MPKKFLWLENMLMILDISAEGGQVLGKEEAAELQLVRYIWHCLTKLESFFYRLPLGVKVISCRFFLLLKILSIYSMNELDACMFILAMLLAFLCYNVCYQN